MKKSTTIALNSLSKLLGAILLLFPVILMDIILKENQPADKVRYIVIFTGAIAVQFAIESMVSFTKARKSEQIAQIKKEASLNKPTK